MRFLYSLILIVPLLCISCKDDDLLKGNLYTFKGETITQYVNNQKDLSMFAKLMERSYNSSRSNTTVASLLGSRGNYTAFIPTNKAVTTYLDSIYGKGKYDIDTIPKDVANRIVLNCVMDFGDEKPYMESEFREGTVPEAMLNGYNLLIRYGNYGNGVITQINRNSYVIKHDIELSNGLVHWVDRVIEPTAQTVPQLIKDVDSLSIFYHLLEATSWEDSLVKFKDDTYVPPTDASIEYAEYRLYGYTVFAEPNKVFHEKWGVPLPQLAEEDGHVENWDEIMGIICKKCGEVYGNSTSSDYTDPGNSLNKFVAYHLVDGKYSSDNIVTPIDKGRNNQYSAGFTLYAPIDSWRYYCTKGANREMLKITHVVKDGTTRINRKSYYNNAFDGDYQESSCAKEGIRINGDTDEYGWNYARNGYYFTLDDILLYSDEVRYGVLNERIRYDISHYLPELSTTESYHRDKLISLYFPYNYFSNLTRDDNAYLCYSYGKLGYENDLIMSIDDAFSYNLKLMPVPYAGKWQVRISSSVWNGVKSCDRVYFGPTLNINQMEYLDFLEPEIFNWYLRTKQYVHKQDILFDYDSLSCRDNDKQLYQHHLMKGPKGMPVALSTYPVYYKKIDGSLKLDGFVPNVTFRDYYHQCRIILHEGYMEPDKTYYIKVVHKKDLQELDLQKYHPMRTLDYIELVPESIYDNPSKAEDIW